MIDEPEGLHAHHSSGIKWLDLALAIAVLALSGASLLTAQHTGRTMEKLVEENGRLVRANATPVLQFLTGNVDAGQRVITFNVANVGTGTARVISFEVAKDGRARRNVVDLLDYEPKASERDYVPTQPVANTYFPAGEARPILQWKYPSGAVSQAKWRALDVDRYKLNVTACFCSVLGECWTSHLRADVPKPVKQCDTRGRINLQG